MAFSVDLAMQVILHGVNDKRSIAHMISLHTLLPVRSGRPGRQSKDDSHAGLKVIGAQPNSKRDINWP